MHNFKSFCTKKDVQDTTINFRPGINYIVGNNNVGKTTIFNAIDFVIHGSKKELCISKNHENEDVSVTIVLGDVNNFEKESSRKYNNYIDNGTLKIQRSSTKTTIKQGNKDKVTHLDIKTVRVWNPEKQQYENPTGIGSVITNLIDPQIVYAESHNEDYQNFGSTKITGKVINSIANNFTNSKEFMNFKDAHAKAFGSAGIEGCLKDTEQEMNNILNEQFGETQVSFKFNFPSFNDLLKKGTLLSTEHGVTTDISEKGNGLQRAVALAIIQIYSRIKSKNDNIQYLIDEPEIYLHPQAQDKLMKSLSDLSSSGNQIFVTTHSPYILRNYNERNDSIIIISTNDNGIKNINSVDSLMFHPTSIGEVTYRAFGVPTVDFHQILFTQLYLKWIESNPDVKINLSKFDINYLKKHVKKEDIKDYYPRHVEYGKDKEWRPLEQRSLPYIVRNEIDHPETLENSKNVCYKEYLKKSIEDLIKLNKSFPD